MKISLVGSYNLADGYLGAAKALRKIGHEVFFIPAQAYKADFPEKHLDMVIEDLKKYDSDVVLLWRGETMGYRGFSRIKNEVNGIITLYSWDDPFQWECHKDMPEKSRYIDVAYSCCMDSVKMYLDNGAKKAVYLPPGFDPEVHYPEEDDEYKCDISLVCTNLYDVGITKYPHISRKKLMLDIIREFPDKDIRIYGPENLKYVFGERYKGWIKFEESRKVFFNSKINICTHIRPDGYKYINERVCQILGSGGLLLVDPVNGLDELFSIGEEILIMEYESGKTLKNQIQNILNNYGEYEKIKINGLKKSLNNYTWLHVMNVMGEGLK